MNLNLYWGKIGCLYWGSLHELSSGESTCNQVLVDPYNTGTMNWNCLVEMYSTGTIELAPMTNPIEIH